MAAALELLWMRSGTPSACLQCMGGLVVHAGKDEYGALPQHPHAPPVCKDYDKPPCCEGLLHRVPICGKFHLGFWLVFFLWFRLPNPLPSAGRDVTRHDATRRLVS